MLLFQVKTFVYQVLVVCALSLFSVTPVLAQAAEPSLSFEFNALAVKAGDSFSTVVVLDTGGFSAEGAGAQIIFDPNVLSVLKVEKGSLYADYPIAAFDNNKGHVSISGIVSGPGESYSGRGAFATITWRLEQARNTEVFFSFTPGSTTDSNIATTRGNGDLLQSVGNLKITASPITEVPVSSFQSTSTVEESPVVVPQDLTAVPQVLQSEGPLASIKSWSLRIWNNLNRRINMLLGRSTIDPYEPISQLDPQTTLRTEQNEPGRAQILSGTQGSELTATPRGQATADWLPWVVGSLLIILLVAVAVWWKKRKDSQVSVSPYKPPDPVPPTPGSPYVQ